MAALRQELDAIRSIDPSTRPQFPYDEDPVAREASHPTYSIHFDDGVLIPMRDGVRLAADIVRPSAPGQRFPALVAASPYSRQLQRTSLPVGQTEAGISEFWVPHGYVHVVVDVRGTNDSEGSWDHMGPEERRDLAEVIEWVAAQPWCDGNVGMTGESYFGWVQLMVATEQPEPLKAIFPNCASVDLYRDRYFHGGIFRRGLNSWFSAVHELNGRRSDGSGIRHHQDVILSMEHPFDGPYYQDRLSWPRLDRITIPTYIVGTWKHVGTHLRAAFEAWDAVGAETKRLVVGPSPRPRKPMAAYHREALRWYDCTLKGMDSGVLDGPPIHLYVQGLGQWRGEQEWPLARTQWRELFLAGRPGDTTRSLADTAGPDGDVSYRYDPATRDAYLGGPRIVYRTETVDEELEISGPLVLELWATSSAVDTDWFVSFADEDPDGSVRELTNGWLRASHRELDPVRSKPWRPFHPHLRAEALSPGEATPFTIEIWPTSNVFLPGHRIRLEISSCDNQAVTSDAHQAVMIAATNTILEGRAHPSRLLVPVIPPR